MTLKLSTDIEKRLEAVAQARGVMEISPKFLALLECSQNSVLEGHGLDHDEFWARIETPNSDQPCRP
jgi:hypothetical protein